MATIDKVKEMRQQGHDDPKIATILQEQGISPREINDALAQSKIKAAVSENLDQEPQSSNRMNIQPGMQPSMMQHEGQTQSKEPGFQALPQEGPHAQEVTSVPQPIPQEQEPEAYPDPYAPQEYTSEEYAGGYGEGYARQEYASQQSTSSETVSEIASQIINTKMKKVNKTLNELTEVNTLLTNKVEKMDSRLERIENIIDQLQTSLLRKANEQEQNIGDIKTEMQDMQKGFSKILNPLFDIERSLEKPRGTRKKTTKKKKK